MILKSLAVAAGSVAAVLAAGGSAFADDVVVPGSNGFGGSTVVVGDVQSGVVVVDAPVADARCIAPWYGSSVIGGSTPIGQMNVVCDDINNPVTQWQNNSRDAVLG